MWLLLLVYIMVLGFLMLILSASGDKMIMVMQGVVFVIVLFSLFIVLWMFPLQAKFVNTIGGTIRNAFILSFKHLQRTLCMVLVALLPIALLIVLSVKWYIILILFGFSAPYYLCALLYDKVFEELEEAFMLTVEENETEQLETTTV